jgi:hypothetical protein
MDPEDNIYCQRKTYDPRGQRTYPEDIIQTQRITFGPGEKHIFPEDNIRTRRTTYTVLFFQRITFRPI